MRTVIAEDPDSLSAHLQAWDALAVQHGRPYCAPAWMLSWWQEARGPHTKLRTVLVLQGDELVGVAPFFAQLGVLGLVEMRLLGAGFCHRIGPLARPGMEAVAARAVAAALASMTPRPDSVVFEGMDAADPWPELIAQAWPGPAPRLRCDLEMEAPVVTLEGSYEEWFERRARTFRKEARRTARRLEEEQVHSRMCAQDDAIDALMALHHARWAGRGGSNVGAEARRVIAEAARRLEGTGRLEIALLETSDAPVAAELVLRAGDTAVFWGGGFDPSWSRSAPGTQALLLALRELAGEGTRVADLGGGPHEYKLRLADRNQPLAWCTLFPRGPRYPLIRARLAPKQAVGALRRWARSHPRIVRARRALRRRAA